MTIAVAHSTTADDSFSATGAIAWNANHTLTGVGTMAEQDANNVAITGGTITGISGLGTVTSVTGTGTVSGITLSGTVTSTGNITLGGGLDLSSPPTIGSVLPNDITGATITGAKFVGISGGAF